MQYKSTQIGLKFVKEELLAPAIEKLFEEFHTRAGKNSRMQEKSNTDPCLLEHQHNLI